MTEYIRNDDAMKRRRSAARGLAYALMTADLTQDYEASARLLAAAEHEELQDTCRYLAILLGQFMIEHAGGSRAIALLAHRTTTAMEEEEIQRGRLE